MAVLVTGGLGYIGSHVVRLLQQSGQRVVVVDRSRLSHHRLYPGAETFHLDLVSPDAVGELNRILLDHGVDSTIHLAALKQVGESVRMPAYYYAENVGGLANVLRAIEGTPVRSFVFSSSAAVYGSAGRSTVRETDPLSPINPYGQTKLAGEWLVRAVADALGIRALSLRYFNVAGAGWADLGDRQAQNLLTKAMGLIREGGAPIIFGDDYPTADGTPVRDYVHVLDLAAAHITALDYLRDAQRPVEAMNVGRGIGVTVRQVLDELSRVSGVPVEFRIDARRPGDSASVVADVDLSSREMSWRADLDLHAIVESAWTSDVDPANPVIRSRTR